MQMVLSGGDFGGESAEFASGDVGDAVELDAGVRFARYEIHAFTENGIPFRQAVFVGYVVKS